MLVYSDHFFICEQLFFQFPVVGQIAANAFAAEAIVLAAADGLDRLPAAQAQGEEAEAAAAKAANLNYVHLPFNAAAPDPMLVDNFLKALSDPKNQPAFIHCASANRAAALWMIKRVELDKWDVDRASAEATALGLSSPALKTFVMEQIQARKK